jgi:ABC-type phosphate transport system substrate-binding protein
MVNLKNPVNNLSIEQIQDIYMGNIVNWAEVGGPDCEMKPYVRDRNSGSQEKFEMMVMKGLTIKDFVLGYAYDINTMGYNIPGSHEIALSYCFKLDMNRTPRDYRSVRYL